MPEHVDENTRYDESPRLAFRGYQRHRKQSKWGTWALCFPPAALLWTVFWLLLLNQASPPDAATPNQPSRGLGFQVWMLAIGDALFLLAGSYLAVRGISDSYYKHGRAALALAINLVLFVALLIAMSLRLFAGSVAA